MMRRVGRVRSFKAFNSGCCITKYTNFEGFYPSIFSYFDKYSIAFVSDWIESLKSPKPKLHELQSIPRILPVLWQWSKWVLLPEVNSLEHIIHVYDWFLSILLKSISDTEYFIFLWRIELYRFLHSIQSFLKPSFASFRFWYSDSGFSTPHLVHFFIDTPNSLLVG